MFLRGILPLVARRALPWLMIHIGGCLGTGSPSCDGLVSNGMAWLGKQVEGEREEPSEMEGVDTCYPLLHNKLIQPKITVNIINSQVM